jgi:Rrf2 family protein
MKISRSTGYGLVAVGYIAQHYKEAPVLAQRVAKEYNIPLEYLLKILQLLVRADVLRSKRGPRGGFTLARPAEKINLLEIIEAVEGSLMGHLNLAEQTSNEPFSIRMERVCENAAKQGRAIFENANLAKILKG